MGALQLLPDSEGFGAVVHQRFLKPGMLQRLLCRDARLRIVNEDALQQIQEELVELVTCGNELLGVLVLLYRRCREQTHVKLFHRPHVLPRSTSRFVIRVVEFIPDKVSNRSADFWLRGRMTYLADWF